MNPTSYPSQPLPIQNYNPVGISPSSFNSSSYPLPISSPIMFPPLTSQQYNQSYSTYENLSNSNHNPQYFNLVSNSQQQFVQQESSLQSMFAKQNLTPYNDKEFLCQTFNFRLPFIQAFLTLTHQEKFKFFLLVEQRKLTGKLPEPQIYKQTLQKIANIVNPNNNKNQIHSSVTDQQVKQKIIQNTVDRVCEYELRKLGMGANQQPSNESIKFSLQTDEEQFSDFIGEKSRKQSVEQIQHINYLAMDQKFQKKQSSFHQIGINQPNSTQKTQISSNTIKSQQKQIQEEDWEWNQQEQNNNTLVSSNFNNYIDQPKQVMSIWELDMNQEEIKRDQPDIRLIFGSNRPNNAILTQNQNQILSFNHNSQSNQDKYHQDDSYGETNLSNHHYTKNDQYNQQNQYNKNIHDQNNYLIKYNEQNFNFNVNNQIPIKYIVPIIANRSLAQQKPQQQQEQQWQQAICSGQIVNTQQALNLPISIPIYIQQPLTKLIEVPIYMQQALNNPIKLSIHNQVNCNFEQKIQLNAYNQFQFLQNTTTVQNQVNLLPVDMMMNFFQPTSNSNNWNVLETNNMILTDVPLNNMWQNSILSIQTNINPVNNIVSSPTINLIQQQINLAQEAVIQEPTKKNDQKQQIINKLYVEKANKLISMSSKSIQTVQSPIHQVQIFPQMNIQKVNEVPRISQIANSMPKPTIYKRLQKPPKTLNLSYQTISNQRTAKQTIECEQVSPKKIQQKPQEDLPKSSNIKIQQIQSSIKIQKINQQGNIISTYNRKSNSTLNHSSLFEIKKNSLKDNNSLYMSTPNKRFIDHDDELISSFVDVQEDIRGSFKKQSNAPIQQLQASQQIKKSLQKLSSSQCFISMPANSLQFLQKVYLSKQYQFSLPFHQMLLTYLESQSLTTLSQIETTSKLYQDEIFFLKEQKDKISKIVSLNLQFTKAVEQDLEEIVAETIMESKQLCFQVTLNVKEVQAIYLRLINKSKLIQTRKDQLVFNQPLQNVAYRAAQLLIYIQVPWQCIQKGLTYYQPSNQKQYYNYCTLILLLKNFYPTNFLNEFKQLCDNLFTYLSCQHSILMQNLQKIKVISSNYQRNIQQIFTQLVNSQKMSTYLIGLHKIASLGHRILNISMFLRISTQSQQTKKLFKIIKQSKMLAQKYNLLPKKDQTKDQPIIQQDLVIIFVKNLFNNQTVNSKTSKFHQFVRDFHICPVCFTSKNIDHQGQYVINQQNQDNKVKWAHFSCYHILQAISQQQKTA